MRSRLKILGVLVSMLLMAPEAPAQQPAAAAPREGLEDAHLRLLWQVGEAHGGGRVPVEVRMSTTWIGQESQRPAPEPRFLPHSLVGGYVVEGHVPPAMFAAAREKPAILGLAAPGMPPVRRAWMCGFTPYNVLKVARDGTASVYATHPRSNQTTTKLRSGTFRIAAAGVGMEVDDLGG